MLRIPADPLAVPAAATIIPPGVNISSARMLPAWSVGSSTAKKNLFMSNLISSGIEIVGQAVIVLESIFLSIERCMFRTSNI